MSKILLDIQNIFISYDKKKSYILRDISFSLWEGEVLSIIWKNGTGKSSLLKAIAGVQKISSWNIKKNTKKIAYVPQKLQLEKDVPLSVKEFFRIFNSKVDSKKMWELLSFFSTEKLLTQNIHTLSGGEFQKILIINALLSDPDVLLLDEPTSGIDVVWEELFYKIISDIKKIFPKMSIILVSHNLSLVYKNSSRVICLHENNFCCHGTPTEMQENIDVQNIFGEYLRPYEHNPHTKHSH